MFLAKLFKRADVYQWLNEITAEELILWLAYLDMEAKGKLDHVPAEELGDQLKALWGSRGNPN